MRHQGRLLVWLMGFAALAAPQAPGQQVQSVPEGIRTQRPPAQTPPPGHAVRDEPPIGLSVAIKNVVGPLPGLPSRPPTPGTATAEVSIKARADLDEFTLRVSTWGGLTTTGATDFAPYTDLGVDTVFDLKPTAGIARVVPRLQYGQEVKYSIPIQITKFGKGQVLAVTAPVGGSLSHLTTTAHDLLLAEGNEVAYNGTTFLDLEIKQTVARMKAASAPNSDIESTVRRLKRSGGKTSNGGVTHPPAPAPGPAPAPVPESAPRAFAVPAAAPDDPVTGYTITTVDVFRGTPATAPAPTPTPAPVPAPAPAGSITVTGQVRFTDSTGGTHPVRFAYVELKQPTNGTGEDPNYAQGYTDALGQYSLSFVPPAGVTGPVTTYLVPYTYGDAIAVYDLSGLVYALESAPRSVAPGAANQIDLTAGYAGTGNAAANWSFAAFEAANHIAGYAATLLTPGAVNPTVLARFKQRLAIYYPLNQEGAYYNGAVNIALGDAHDWDVIMHEYGHHVQSVFKLANYLPGVHFIGADNCSTSPNTKPNGTALAWGEGWPTFFGTMAQAELGLAALGIPNVGDTSYTDLRPGGNPVAYDLASPANPSDRGEGDEVAVQRVLYDFYSKTTGITPKNLWDVAANTTTVRLSDFCKNLLATQPTGKIVSLGEILAAHGMGPSPTLPANGATLASNPPTFSWVMRPIASQCDGSAGEAQYDLVLTVDNFASVLFRKSGLATSSYTLSPTEWTAVRAAGSTTAVRRMVHRTGSNSPQTGPFAGATRTFILP